MSSRSYIIREVTGRMRRTNKVSFPVNIGAASLLVVFLVLCIATFAGLSLSAAKSDENAASQMRERRSSYYDASNRSESLVQIIDRAAGEARRENPADGWMKAAKQKIEEETAGLDSVEVSVEEQNGVPVISWEIYAAEDQILQVEVVLQEPDADGNLYRICTWKTVPKEEWEAGGAKTMLPVIPQ